MCFTQFLTVFFMGFVAFSGYPLFTADYVLNNTHLLLFVINRWFLLLSTTFPNFIPSFTFVHIEALCSTDALCATEVLSSMIKEKQLIFFLVNHYTPPFLCCYLLLLTVIRGFSTLFTTTYYIRYLTIPNSKSKLYNFHSKDKSNATISSHTKKKTGFPSRVFHIAMTMTMNIWVRKPAIIQY